MNKMQPKPRVKKPSLEEIIPDKQIRDEIMTKLYQGDPLFGEKGIFTNMLQSFVNAALEGEMDDFMKVSKVTSPTNRRNGHTNKMLRSTAGPIGISTPRDREGDYDPVIVKKRERELSTGLDEIIISLYARGQSIEDVRFQLKNIYGIDVSAGAISAITDRVWTDIIEWQQRTLSSCYAIVYLDAIHYKVREDGKVISKAIYTVYAINVHGERDVLGLYLRESEGSRQWGLILEDLKRRGVQDVLFFSVDGLSGFKDVIEHVFPKSNIQRCIVHKIRNSTRYVSRKDITQVCKDLRRIYTSADIVQADVALEAFNVKWGLKYDEIVPSWKKDWNELMVFMDYGDNIKRILYTTNPVEAIHRIMRKVTKTKGAWSNDKGLLKQLYLTLKYNEKGWKRNAYNWDLVKRELMHYFGDRYTSHL